MKRLFILLLASSLLAVAGSAATATPAAAWWELLHLSASGTVAEVNNISRTSYAPTRQDARTYEFSLSGSDVRQLAPSLLLLASAQIDSLTVQEYGLTDNVRYSGRLTLQNKFGLGPQAPVLQGFVAATFKAARLGADRGWTTEAGLSLSKRLLPNLRLAATVNVLEHAARSATFDLNQHSFTLDARWDINESWTLSGSASRLKGDIVANAVWSVWGMALGGVFGPEVQRYYSARPWSVTNLYGSGWVSYNVEADVDLWSVALGYSFNNRTVVELRKSAAYVVNRLGIAYPTDSWGLSLSHRF